MADLPPTITPRVLTKAQVGEYCGIAIDTVSDWMARGLIPCPIPGTQRWDRKNIDLYLDRASGIVRQSEDEQERERVQADILKEITSGL